ncbi:MAG TPA: AI-2E family transporter [Vicinamibacterales bacterium]|jgi:predicted PurR-regulated permease PerM|nr:AI-2E family transporter [Vicinamibacterales bacterium]
MKLVHAQPEPPPMKSAVDIRSAALTILAVLAVVLVLQYAQSVIIPIVIGLLISYALDPLVAWMARRRVPRPIGAALVLAILAGAGGYMLYSLRSEATAIVDQLPRGARRLRQLLEADRPSTAPTAIQQMQKAATELERAADAAAPPPPPSGVQRVQVQPPPFNMGDYLMWGSMSLATAAGQCVLILFLVYFLLASGDLYRRKLVKIAGPSLTQKRITLQILSEIDRQIERFLLVQVFTSTVVGVVTWLAFRAMGMQQAAVWGILAGVFNSIPYFGPVLVTVATVTVAFLQFGNLHMPLLIGAVALVITTLEGFLLTPWLNSRAARMNAIAVFIGLLFWGWIWNVWGMLLAVPMLMVLKAICDHVDDLKPIGELLGE